MHADGNTPMIEGGRVLAGRYKLLEKIGEGGAAEVFRARDQHLGRLVAIKLLRPQFTSDPQSRNRFVVEARAAATLSQRNIVDIFDFGEAPDGAMYIVMQYVEGEDLKALLRQRGRMSPSEVVSIARQVCLALSVAHAKGLIHRDVKPQNIMIDSSGNAQLTDFGVVKALSAPALTQSGMTFGTAAYLSPEQATGSAIGPASDIYSLGCAMYEMLAGTPPFTGDNAAVVAYKQVWEQPRPLHDMVPEVPPSLETIVMRCLNKEPEKRYSSADMLAADLERLNSNFGQPTQAVPLGTMAAAAASARGLARGDGAATSHPMLAVQTEALCLPCAPKQRDIKAAGCPCRRRMSPPPCARRIPGLCGRRWQWSTRTVEGQASAGCCWRLRCWRSWAWPGSVYGGLWANSRPEPQAMPRPRLQLRRLPYPRLPPCPRQRHVLGRWLSSRLGLRRPLRRPRPQTRPHLRPPKRLQRLPTPLSRPSRRPPRLLSPRERTQSHWTTATL